MSRRSPDAGRNYLACMRYPIDLAHNFVLSHPGCNGAKAENLAAGVYLGRWVERNRTEDAFLEDRFDQGLIVHRAQSSERIARWAYSQAAASRDREHLVSHMGDTPHGFIGSKGLLSHCYETKTSLSQYSALSYGHSSLPFESSRPRPD